MDEIQIKGESLPVRCEVCHQSDCFEPQTNHCTRCVGLQDCKRSLSSDANAAIQQYSRDPFFKVLGFVCLSLGTLSAIRGLSAALNRGLSIELIIGIIFLIAGFMFPYYYRWRCRQLEWVLENVSPVDTELTLCERKDLPGSRYYYVELHSDKIRPSRIDLNHPSWDVYPLIGRTIAAQIYSDPKGGTIILVGKGLLMSQDRSK